MNKEKKDLLNKEENVKNLRPLTDEELAQVTGGGVKKILSPKSPIATDGEEAPKSEDVIPGPLGKSIVLPAR